MNGPDLKANEIQQRLAPGFNAPWLQRAPSFNARHPQFPIPIYHRCRTCPVPTRALAGGEPPSLAAASTPPASLQSSIA